MIAVAADMLHESTPSDLGSAQPRRRAAAKPCGERWRSPRSAWGLRSTLSRSIRSAIPRTRLPSALCFPCRPSSVAGFATQPFSFATLSRIPPSRYASMTQQVGPRERTSLRTPSRSFVSGLVLLALRCLGFSGVWLVISQRAKTRLAATRVGPSQKPFPCHM